MPRMLRRRGTPLSLWNKATHARQAGHGDMLVRIAAQRQLGRRRGIPGRWCFGLMAAVWRRRLQRAVDGMHCDCATARLRLGAVRAVRSCRCVIGNAPPAPFGLAKLRPVDLAHHPASSSSSLCRAAHSQPRLPAHCRSCRSLPHLPRTSAPTGHVAQPSPPQQAPC